MRKCMATRRRLLAGTRLAWHRRHRTAGPPRCIPTSGWQPLDTASVVSGGFQHLAVFQASPDRRHKFGLRSVLECWTFASAFRGAFLQQPRDAATGPPKNPRGGKPQTSGPVDSTCSSGSSVQTMAIAAARHARDANKQAQRAQPPLPAGV